MKSLEDFNYLLSLDRRYTKTESEIFRSKGKASPKRILYREALRFFAELVLSLRNQAFGV